MNQPLPSNLSPAVPPVRPQTPARSAASTPPTDPPQPPDHVVLSPEAQSALQAAEHGGVALAGVGNTPLTTYRDLRTGDPVMFYPKGYRNHSTSSVFIGEPGPKWKKGVRLDHGANAGTGTEDTHWNVKGCDPAGTEFHDKYDIDNHAPAGRAGDVTHHSLQAAKGASRALVVAGVAMDVCEVAASDDKVKTATEKVAGWGGAWVGAEAGGTAGATVGSFAGPLGTALGAAVGGLVGGVLGYCAGEAIGCDLVSQVRSGMCAGSLL